MKKTLMALAVGSAFVAPAAFADVTISGSINMGVEYLNVGKESNRFATQAAPFVGGNGTQHDGVGNIGVASNYTNITIASMEDLGGGLKLDFAAQIDWNTTGAGNSLNNRNSHIGLVGESWGGVWYGSNENIYERYFYTQDPLDGAAGLGGNLQIFGNPGAGHVFDAPSGNPANTPGSRAGFYRRDEQVVWYDSPNFSGVTFGAAIGTTYAADSCAAGFTGTCNTDPWMWQVGVKYVGTSMPLQVWGAYNNHKDYYGLADITANQTGIVGGQQSGTSSNDRAAQVGVGYTLGDIFMFAQYETLQYKINNSVATAAIGNPVIKYSRDAWGLGVKWNLASGYVGAQYIAALKGDCTTLAGPCNADDTASQMIGLGYYHTMSKQTQVYVVGSWLGNDDLANYRTAGVSNGAVGVNVGADYTGIGVGIKHSF